MKWLECTTCYWFSLFELSGVTCVVKFQANKPSTHRSSLHLLWSFYRWPFSGSVCIKHIPFIFTLTCFSSVSYEIKFWFHWICLLVGDKWSKSRIGCNQPIRSIDYGDGCLEMWKWLLMQPQACIQTSETQTLRRYLRDIIKRCKANVWRGKSY